MLPSLSNSSKIDQIPAKIGFRIFIKVVDFGIFAKRGQFSILPISQFFCVCFFKKKIYFFLKKKFYFSFEKKNLFFFLKKKFILKKLFLLKKILCKNNISQKNRRHKINKKYILTYSLP